MISLFCLIAYTDCFSGFYVKAPLIHTKVCTPGPQRSYLLFDLHKDNANTHLKPILLFF